MQEAQLSSYVIVINPRMLAKFAYSVPFSLWLLEEYCTS